MRHELYLNYLKTIMHEDLQYNRICLDDNEKTDSYDGNALRKSSQKLVKPQQHTAKSSLS